jgi:hypothetical protein
MTMTLKAQREARIAARAAEKLAKLTAEKARIESNPIHAAIAPQKDASVAHAMEYTRERLLKFAAQFPVGSNLCDNAPRANSWQDGHKTYQEKQARRALATRVLTFAPVGYMPHAPLIVTGLNEEGIERLCDEAGDEAAASFDAYVAKLTAKVGQCDHASVDGWLWQSSILRVVKGATVERWNTQQILNFSVYGKAFNQWPTRLLK